MKPFKTAILLLLGFVAFNVAEAQYIVLDPGHLEIVLKNGLTREAAEKTHQNYLTTINQRLSDINLDVSSVVLVQNIIWGSLKNVDQTLKEGLTVRQMAAIILEITDQCDQMLALVRKDPALLLFAQDVAQQLKTRGINLATEVSTFVLKEGDTVLMNYEKREQLLSKIILELRVMRALSYSMYKAMYWANQNRLIKSINPYRKFINQDTRLADDLILQYQFLKP